MDEPSKACGEPDTRTNFPAPAPGEAAAALCGDPDVAKVAGTAPFTTPGGNTVTSILLQPQPITRENLNLVLDAGWITKETLCQGVTDAAVAVCQ